MAIAPFKAFTVLCVLCLHLAMSLRIQIDPPMYMDESWGGVRISCFTEASDACAKKDVILLSVGRELAKPMATVRLRSGISYGTVSPNSSYRYQAHGVVGDYRNKSSLNVTIPNPKNSDTGRYFCKVYYFDESGAFKEEIVFGNVSVKRTDIHDTVRKLEQRVAELEGKLEYKASTIPGRIQVLENKTQTLKDDLHNQSLQINRLADKESFMVAFAATIKGPKVIENVKEVLVFNDVTMRVGEGYNDKTGIFTAPRAGIYVFHLTIKTDGSISGVIDLKVNERVVATVHTWVPSGIDDQSSVSAVVTLQEGDRVKAVVVNNIEWSERAYNLFSGYIIHVF